MGRYLTRGKADSLHARLRAMEKQIIEAALQDCGGYTTRAARKLGIARTSLHDRIRALGIDIYQFRVPWLHTSGIGR